MDLTELTPVQRFNDIYIKRDDLFEFAGCKGSKVRGALYIIHKAMALGFTTFVSAGSRLSPQCEIISCICEKLNLQCHLFMPASKNKTSVMQHVEANSNTTMHYVQKGGYTNVLISYAKKLAKENGWYYIPFGMEMQETIDIIGEQVQNIPKEVKRIVMPIGSGMNFCAVLNGLDKYNKNDIQVVGIAVGKNPIKVINTYYPMFKFSKHKVIYSKYPYEKQVFCTIGDMQLDPVYEAKCYEYLKPNDLFWVVGQRILEKEL